MSVKSMTTEQLQDDLEAIARMWPAGIPAEQNDRVTALKGELKRRGADMRTVRAQAPNEKPMSISAMSDEQLEQELRKLSTIIGANPKDEDSQNRFADVRFEMRRRAKAEPPSSPPVQPREIEIPDAETVRAEKPQPPQGEQVRTKPTNGVSMKGFSADIGGRGIILKYTAQDTFGNIAQVASSMSVDEAEAHVAHVQAAIDKTKGLS